MNVPAIGGARGVFEIFVPGLFLLTNFGVAIYGWPGFGPDTRKEMLEVACNPTLGLVAGVSFGYLIGLLLRTFPIDWLDAKSAWYLRHFDPDARDPEGVLGTLTREKFPFFARIEQVCKACMPVDVLRYYESVWQPRDRAGELNLWFHNLCKVMVNSVDTRSGLDVYGQEATCRYTCCTFYAMLIASALALVLAFAQAKAGSSLFVASFIVFLAYFFGIRRILMFFRFLRVKEVETLFAACYANNVVFTQQARRKLAAERARRADEGSMRDRNG